MKKIILLALTALMMVGCEFSVEDDTKACIKQYHVIILDSCEYYSNKMKYDITHKGNCRFCKERRQKELKELVEQYKREITMTKEDKELVFKDLSARLPHHVRVKVWFKDGTTEEGILDLKHNYGDVLRDAFYYNKIVDIKPYLRPMSSMTEEKKDTYDTLTMCNAPWVVNDWLNKNMFDYRGLIEKGLALEAQEGMYNITK